MQKRRRFFKWGLALGLVLLLSLVALRIALPTLVKNYVNHTLDEMPDYDGEIGDVDMMLWRGAYEIQGVNIVKTTGKVPVPFFSCQVVQFSVEWKALWQGAWVGEVMLQSPVMNFVKGPTESSTQVGLDQPWLDVIKKLFPLDLNRFEVRNGTMHYRDFHSRPKVDLVIDQIAMLGKNFTNSESLSKNLVADITATGRFEQGKLNTVAKVDPSSQRPTFDLDLKLSPVALVRLNDFAKAYGGFDFEKGTLSLATEIAVSEGSLTGYVKPLFDDVAVVDVKEDIKNPLRLAWESVVGGVTRLFRNQRKQRFATRIPLKGSLSDPKIFVFPTIANIFRNAFVKAYQGNIENMVDLEDGRTSK